MIEEAKHAQIQCDYLAPLKKPFKILVTMIVPIIAFDAQKNLQPLVMPLHKTRWLLWLLMS